MQQIIVFALAGLLGLVTGSFLNVLIYRGPASWNLIDPDQPRGSLWGPRSQCPSCRVQIKSWHNIPVFSYLMLRGKCANCDHKIPVTYPMVEALGAVAGIVAVYCFGWTLAAAGMTVFLCILLSLGMIDYQTGYLPDALTFPLIILGLIANGFSTYTPPLTAIIGAFAGYGSFWMIAFYYKVMRKRDGLGLGDAKLLAGLGAWAGWTALPPLVLMASLGALLWIGVSALTGRSYTKETMIRFGPALAIAGAIIFIWRNWPGPLSSHF